MVLAERLARRKDERQVIEQGQYLVNTRYWTHRKYIEIKRKTVVETNWKNEVEPLGMVQYVFEDQPHYMSPNKHGNAKGSKRFYPTSKSTKNNIIKRVLSCQGPSKIYVQAFEEAGKDNSSTRGSNYGQKLKQTSWPVFFTKVEIVCSVDSMPTPTMIRSKGVFEDVVSNCCNPEKFGVFLIDTT